MSGDFVTELLATSRAESAATTTSSLPRHHRAALPLCGMPEYMPRTTVTLPADVSERLRHEAERQGVTDSELTREAIEVFLALKGKRGLLAAGAGASGRSDNSERIEEILANEGRPSH